MATRRMASGPQAGMAELADVQDLGSCAARRVGSTPTTRTKRTGPPFGSDERRGRFCVGSARALRFAAVAALSFRPRGVFCLLPLGRGDDLFVEKVVDHQRRRGEGPADGIVVPNVGQPFLPA